MQTMRLIDADALKMEMEALLDDNELGLTEWGTVNREIDYAPILMTEYEYKLAKQMLELLYKKLDEGMMTGETD